MRYVNIPYGLKDYFKQKFPVKWDTDKKSWYLPDYYDAMELKLLLEDAEKIAARQNIAFTATAFFKDAINTPTSVPAGAKTVFQWSKEEKFPKDVEHGGIMATPLKDGKTTLDETGSYREYGYFKPEEVRELRKEDEKYLMSHYSSYKTHFTEAVKTESVAETNTVTNPETVTDKKPVIEPKTTKLEPNPSKDPKITGMFNKSFFKDLCRREIRNIDNPIYPVFDKNDPANKFLVLDTETTGFDPVNKDELLQLSIFNQKGEPVFSSLIKPYILKNWYGAMQKNHISPHMVQNVPYPHEYAPIINMIIKNADTILGYNTPFDIKFIEECLCVDCSGKQILDPCKTFKEEHPEGHHTLEDALKYYCTPEVLEKYEANKHRADTDSLATLDLYNAMEQRNKEDASSLEILESGDEEIER